MRATVMFGAGDVRIENIPDARLVEPTDAVVRVSRAAVEALASPPGSPARARYHFLDGEGPDGSQPPSD
jgi:hypothetical protein